MGRHCIVFREKPIQAQIVNVIGILIMLQAHIIYFLARSIYVILQPDRFYFVKILTHFVHYSKSILKISISIRTILKILISVSISLRTFLKISIIISISIRTFLKISAKKIIFFHQICDFFMFFFYEISISIVDISTIYIRYRYSEQD